MKGGRATKADRRKTGMRRDFSCRPGIIICHEKFVRILMTLRFELMHFKPSVGIILAFTFTSQLVNSEN